MRTPGDEQDETFVIVDGTVRNYFNNFTDLMTLGCVPTGVLKYEATFYT